MLFIIGVPLTNLPDSLEEHYTMIDKFASIWYVFSVSVVRDPVKISENSVHEFSKLLKCGSRKFDPNFYSKMPFRAQPSLPSTRKIFVLGIFETFDMIHNIYDYGQIRPQIYIFTLFYKFDSRVVIMIGAHIENIHDIVILHSLHHIIINIHSSILKPFFY